MFRNVERLRAALAKMPDAARASVNPANGRFRAPEFSGRVVAELRKAAIANGYEWTHDKPRGTQKTLTRPGKGHKCDREKPAREAARAEGRAGDDEARRLPGAAAGACGAAARATRDIAGSLTTAPRGDAGDRAVASEAVVA